VKKPRPLIISCAKGDGKLFIGDGSDRDDQRQRRILAAAIKHLPDGPYELEIRPFEETRRSRANRYYFGVVLKMMAEESGATVDDLHEQMKLRHNAKVVADLATGEEVRIAQSTAKLTVSEFSDYLTLVMVDGAEYLGITFPEPRASEEYREGRKAA
jgi:hypothetical protein